MEPTIPYEAPLSVCTVCGRNDLELIASFAASISVPLVILCDSSIFDRVCELLLPNTSIFREELSGHSDLYYASLAIEYAVSLHKDSVFYDINVPLPDNPLPIINKTNEVCINVVDEISAETACFWTRSPSFLSILRRLDFISPDVSSQVVLLNASRFFIHTIF